MPVVNRSMCMSMYEHISDNTLMLLSVAMEHKCR